MSRHHPDLVMCRKQAGVSIGRLCDKCDGKCPVCDSYVRPTTLVRICDECSFGNYQNKCVVCGGEGISDAFYCFECTRLEKDRDGCPKIINLGSSRTDVSRHATLKVLSPSGPVLTPHYSYFTKRKQTGHTDLGAARPWAALRRMSCMSSGRFRGTMMGSSGSCMLGVIRRYRV
ncbi:hypothetical protein RB601_001273 [Gaeumannomyces tritici]